MKRTNIILFSSGVSEQSGILHAIKQSLTEKNCICSDWRELFSQAKQQDQIALLPMLIKKIPTFDYAVLICEGHDQVQILREGKQITYHAMRDNVLFEIGLCCMALGLSKVILVSDGNVHLPDDLIGKENALAIAHIPYEKDENLAWNETTIQPITDRIFNYINESIATVSPVVIGAATSTACGYVNNFICRTLEKIDTGIELITEKGASETHFFPLEKIYFHTVLPRVLENGMMSQSPARDQLLKGRVPKARDRAAEFKYQLEGDTLHIYDFPTTVSTSYDVASMILNIDADDDADPMAKVRFVEKEIALFESSLKALLNREYLEGVIAKFYRESSQEEQAHILNNVASIILNRFILENA